MISYVDAVCGLILILVPYTIILYHWAHFQGFKKGVVEMGSAVQQTLEEIQREQTNRV